MKILPGRATGRGKATAKFSDRACHRFSMNCVMVTAVLSEQGSICSELLSANSRSLWGPGAPVLGCKK